MRSKLLNSTAYRYGSETAILWLTIFLVLAVIALSAAVTMCGSVIFILGMLAISSIFSYLHHQSLIQNAHLITAESAPELAAIVAECIEKFQVHPVQVYVTHNEALNAYTFGLSSSKVIVLYSGLLKAIDADELRFVLGHELGHVRLGHTRLNSLLGGLAGIPSASFASTLLALAFYWWNRACEYSADRAGLLACGRLDKAISTLVKLVTGDRDISSAEMRRYLQALSSEDDSPLSMLGELLATHPLTIKRIEQLQRFAASIR